MMMKTLLMGLAFGLCLTLSGGASDGSSVTTTAAAPVPSAALKAQIRALENRQAKTGDWDAALAIARLLQQNGFHEAAFSVSEGIRRRMDDNDFNVVFARSGRISLQECPGLSQKELEALGEDKADDAVQAFFAKAATTNADFRAYFEFCNRMAKTEEASAAAKEYAAILPTVLRSPVLRHNCLVLPYIARGVLKSLDNRPLAEELYIELYFDDPHFYDGEFAEWRIKHLAKQDQMARWNALSSRYGKDVAACVRDASWSSTYALEVFIQGLTGRPAPEQVPMLFDILASPDQEFRGLAIRMLLVNGYDLKPYAKRILAMQTSDSLFERAHAVILSKSVMTPDAYAAYHDACRKSDIKYVADAARASDRFFAALKPFSGTVRTPSPAARKFTPPPPELVAAFRAYENRFAVKDDPEWFFRAAHLLLTNGYAEAAVRLSEVYRAEKGNDAFAAAFKKYGRLPLARPFDPSAKTSLSLVPLYFDDPFRKESGKTIGKRIKQIRADELTKRFPELWEAFGSDHPAFARYAMWKWPSVAECYLRSLKATNACNPNEMETVFTLLESPDIDVAYQAAALLDQGGYDLAPQADRIRAMRQSSRQMDRALAVILSRKVMTRDEYKAYLRRCMKDGGVFTADTANHVWDAAGFGADAEQK